MSFFEELKRRNVFRVGIAYTVSAWVLLQVVDLVLENIAAPDWVMQIFMLALAIGFPIALIFAWAFELTPDGVKLEKDVDRSKSITKETAQRMNRNIIIALVIAVVLLLVDKFTPDTDVPPPTVSQAPTSETSPEIPAEPELAAPTKSIAVLPFTNMSEDANNAYFSDGISEEILNVLAKVEELKVAGRTSSFAFKGRNEDLRMIGETLGVSYILEGSVRKAGNKVRITSQLIKADDGFHLWSETYDRELTDIFAIQDEIAHAITEALAIELELGDEERTLATVSTSNMEAYDRYLEAIGLIARRVDLPRAIMLLEEATTLDPDFAAGWAAAAQAHSLGIYYDPTIDKEESLTKAESMASRALEIDAGLSMAHSVLGDINRDRFDWVRANESYLRALELNPDNIEANEQYAQMLWRASYFEEALSYSSKASGLDPLSWLNLTVHAALRYVSGDHDGGWDDMQRALRIGGNNRYFALRHALNMSISEGDFEKAAEYMQEISKTRQDDTFQPRSAEQLAQILPLLGSREALLARLRAEYERSAQGEMSSAWATDLFLVAYYGDYDLAVTIFDQGTSVDDGSAVLDTTWFNYPLINPLKNTIAYKRLIKRIRLDEYWRENGFPANCRAVGDDDFACN